jgi:hypothetical protein
MEVIQLHMGLVLAVYRYDQPHLDVCPPRLVRN